VAAVVIAFAAPASAGDSRTYDKPIEVVWDEAVKAIRDADMVLTDSKRPDHWFTMKTEGKTFARTLHFEVELAQTGSRTEVSVRAVDEDGSKKSAEAVARYLEALDRRMD
jgi:carbon monoxide dehydrogenase subunit G